MGLKVLVTALLHVGAGLYDLPLNLDLDLALRPVAPVQARRFVRKEAATAAGEEPFLKLGYQGPSRRQPLLGQNVGMNCRSKDLLGTQLTVSSDYGHGPQREAESFHGFITFLSWAKDSALGVSSFTPWRRNLRSGACMAIAWSSSELTPFW